MKNKRKNILAFHDYSIGKKFTVSLLLFLILPLVLLLILVNYFFMRNVNEQNLKINYEILKQTKIPLDYMEENLRAISMQVIENEDVQEFFLLKDKDSSELRDKLLENIRFSMSQMLEKKDYITRFVLMDEDQIYLQLKAYLGDKEMERELYFDEAAERKGRPYWIYAQYEERYVSAYDRRYEVAMIRALNNPYKLDDIRGYMRFNIDERYLASLYKGIMTQGTENILIADSAGHVVSSADPSFLGTEIVEEEYFRKILEGEKDYFRCQNHIISYYQLSSTGWYVIKIDQLSSIIQGNLLNVVLFLCIAFAILFGAVFLCVQKKQIIEPVQLLSQDVSSFHEGKYQINLYNDSNDEIGTLNHAFINMSAYIEELVERVYKSRLKEKEAQLNYLQSQINPDFLYNTLESIRWMAIKEKQFDMAKQIEALANLFRHALNQGDGMTTISQEVEHLNAYILIQQNKFGKSLMVEVDVEETLSDFPVLNLILQPLVENAIVHGFQDKIGEKHIWVTIRKEKEDVIFTVKDNGVGTDAKQIRSILKSGKETHNAWALDNINKRLLYKYGKNYGLDFESELGQGTVVTVRMPFIQKEQEGNDEAIDRG